MTDFKSTTDRVAALLDHVEDEALPGATPCEEYTVAQLVNHMLGLCLAFTAAAEGVRGPHNDTPPGVPETVLAPDWRPLLEERLRILAEAWGRPSAWEGDATAGGVTFPAAVMGLVGLNEVAIHGWDLAKATGQDYELDEETLETLLAFVGQDADDQAAREGIYGPAIRLADGAAPQDRLVALTGRDPDWRP